MKLEEILKDFDPTTEEARPASSAHRISGTVVSVLKGLRSYREIRGDILKNVFKMCAGKIARAPSERIHKPKPFLFSGGAKLDSSLQECI